MIDTTVQEKNITYPTDAKLAIKIINRLNKLAKRHGINAEPMLKRLKTATLISSLPPVKKRAKAKKALTRLRTIATSSSENCNANCHNICCLRFIKSTSCFISVCLLKTQR
ncbi:hypothetical protein BSPWISOXPB_395 [uncultured Gammaproteobacteria bacterium]|nr:hypothetical protein BSPWISOXPB_395 [uncultured Gammaproteobacteria bacterium]